MLYFANPSQQSGRDAMTAGQIGCIVTPKQGNKIPPRAAWMADNGRFSSLTVNGVQMVGDNSPGWPGPDKYLRWLDGYPRDDCRFAVVPDQPFDMARTLDLAEKWVPVIRGMGYTPVLALQNGAEHMDLPWNDIDGVSIGGDTAWKWSPAASWLCREAHDRGKFAHWLRGNSLKSMRRAWGIHCDSMDGGYLRYRKKGDPDINVRRLLGWLDDLAYRGAQQVI